MDVIFLDTETTGIDIAKDRLCQICYKTSKEIKVEYFKPPIPMPVKAMSITHITNKMLQDKEAFIGSTLFKDLEELISNRIVVAHNAKFDCAILKAEGITVPSFICTLRVARKLDTNNVIPEYSLQYLRYYLDLDVEGNAHDAEGDVKVLEALFNRLLLKIKEKIPDHNSAILEMVKMSSTPVLFKKFNFGKHRDKEIEEVLKYDRGYLEWLLKEKLKDEELEEDWIYTLREYLKE